MLVPVAHGSRDPRSAATVRALVDEVRAQAPGLDVRPAFLDFDAPSLGEVLDGLDGPAVVVPLLLGSAYHARVDIPAVVAAAGPAHPVRVADVLGPDPRLLAVARERLAALGGEPRGIVLAGTGSGHAAANAVVHRLAGDLGAVAAFATTAPRVPEAIAALQARGAERIAVASWFLAPGRLLDRVHEQAGGVPVAEALGAHPAVAEVVLARFAAATRPLLAAAG
ncbi:sirohydrochlorin chelatase [Pseudonocardia xishanensis]|uniref:Sirohydrochlorin chelatase n=1 Tax=Pseudonocardia xishanensis TaxID=630995 RepID=A0ABP8S527_9PSEU